MNNKGRPSGSRRIDPTMRERAIVMRRDEHRVLKEIAAETGISVAHLKTIFRQERIAAPHRGRPPGVKQKEPRADKGKKKQGSAQQAIVRDPDKPKVEPQRKRADISPVLEMQIEDRMRKRREREAADAPLD